MSDLETCSRLTLETEFNLMLLVNNARNAYLLELNNESYMDCTESNILDLIHDWAIANQPYPFSVYKEGKYRFLITNQNLTLEDYDVKLGKLLGFPCAFVSKKFAVHYDITNSDGLTESFMTYVCENASDATDDTIEFQKVADLKRWKVLRRVEERIDMQELGYHMINFQKADSEKWLREHCKYVMDYFGNAFDLPDTEDDATLFEKLMSTHSQWLTLAGAIHAYFNPFEELFPLSQTTYRALKTYSVKLFNDNDTNSAYKLFDVNDTNFPSLLRNEILESEELKRLFSQLTDPVTRVNISQFLNTRV